MTWKRTLLSLCLGTLAACSADNRPAVEPVPAPEEKPPSFLRVHGLGARSPRKVLPLADGALAVLVDRIEVSKDPLGPPRGYGEILRVEKDGSFKVIHVERAKVSRIMDVAVDETGDLLALEVRTRSSLSMEVFALNPRTGERISEIDVDVPHDEPYDRSDLGLSPNDRFFWMYHGYKVGAIHCRNGVISVVARNRLGSVFYEPFRMDANHKLVPIPGARARLVHPGNAGIVGIEYPSSADVFSQRTSIYRTFIAADELGNIYVGSVALETEYLEALGKLDGTPVTWLGPRYAKDQVGLCVTKVAPDGKKQSYFVPFESNEFYFAVSSMKIEKEKLWLVGYERQVKGQSQFRGLVWSVPLAAMESGKASRTLIGAADSATMLSDFLVRDDGVYSVGATGFGFNPAGHSISGPMHGLIERRTRDTQMEVASYASTYQPAAVKGLLKGYTSLTQTSGEKSEICAVGAHSSSTHEADDDYRRIRVEGFVECLPFSRLSGEKLHW